MPWNNNSLWFCLKYGEFEFEDFYLKLINKRPSDLFSTPIDHQTIITIIIMNIIIIIKP